jgi:hypothetical protein
MNNSFKLGVMHNGIRFTLGDDVDIMRLLFIMLYDHVCTPEQALGCLILEYATTNESISFDATG